MTMKNMFGIAALAVVASVTFLQSGLSAQPLAKAAVGEKIKKVEDGVDAF